MIGMVFGSSNHSIEFIDKSRRQKLRSAFLKWSREVYSVLWGRSSGSIPPTESTPELGSAGTRKEYEMEMDIENGVPK